VIIGGGIYRALGFESTRDEMKEILETVDPDNEGYVSYERFLEVAALKMNCLSV
jgi:Ca2+-binding EF-hand superfamily protein